VVRTQKIWALRGVFEPKREKIGGGWRKLEEGGENCTVRGFMICTIHQRVLKK